MSIKAAAMGIYLNIWNQHRPNTAGIIGFENKQNSNVLP